MYFESAGYIVLDLKVESIIIVSVFLKQTCWN